MNKKRIATSVAAVATAAALLLGGTFAWQSISQTALNEASDIVNPGGRLHDDFNGSDKNVYVENFADEPIYARVRFDEYFEIIMNYDGGDAQKSEVVTTYVDEETGETVESVRNDPDTYVHHIFGEDNATDDWWNWTMGDETDETETVYYMPTFNLNKDSLAADVNGVFNGANFDITDKDDGDQYTDYVDYSEVTEKPGYEIYDGDTNSVDELSQQADTIKEINELVNGIVESGDITGYDSNLVLGEWGTHYADVVNPDTGFISMAEWDGTSGPYWVYDTDGWCYWAQPIPGRNNEAGDPNTTGLLMDGIALNGVMDDTWYYAINVVAQFITADDIGDGTEENPGFMMDGMTPEAEALLETIGVQFNDETGGNEETMQTLNLTNEEPYDYAEVAVGEGVKITTLNEEADLSSIIVTNSDEDELEEGFTYEDGILTITDDSYAEQTLYVWDANWIAQGELFVLAGEEEEENVINVYVTPDNLNVKVAASYGQKINVILSDFEDDVTFNEEGKDGDGFSVWVDGKELSFTYDNWRAEELTWERIVTVPLENHDGNVTVTVVNRISIVGADVVANNRSTNLALLNEDGSMVESLSGATFAVSPENAGELAVNTADNDANVTFTPASDYTGSVEVKITYDGVTYRRNILVVEEDELTSVLLYHHDGLGWYLPHETIYKNQWYSYFLVADGVVQHVELPNDSTGFGAEASNGWSITDGVNAPAYYGWSGLAFDQQIAYTLPLGEGSDTSNSLTITYVSDTMNVSTTYNSKPTPEVTISGDVTELSISSNDVYTFTVSLVEPKDKFLRAYLKFQETIGYEDWIEEEYDCSFVVNADNSVTVTVDLSDWPYGEREYVELCFTCFNATHTKSVSVVE